MPWFMKFSLFRPGVCWSMRQSGGDCIYCTFTNTAVPQNCAAGCDCRVSLGDPWGQTPRCGIHPELSSARVPVSLLCPSQQLHSGIRALLCASPEPSGFVQILSSTVLINVPELQAEASGRQAPSQLCCPGRARWDKHLVTGGLQLPQPLLPEPVQPSLLQVSDFGGCFML